MAQKNTIDVLTRFQADISAITKATGEIQKNFNNLKPNASFEKSFTSALTKLQNEISNFEAKAARGISTMGDSRALESSGKKILDLYNQLQNQIKGLGTLSNSEMSKLFPESVGKNIKDAIKLLNDYEASHKKIQTTIEQETKELKKQEAELERLKKLQEELQKTPVGSDSDFRKKNALKRKIEEAPDKRKEILDQAQAEGVKLRKNREIDRRSAGSEEWIKKIELFDAAIKKTQESYDALVKKLEGKIPESTLEKQMQKNQTAIQNTERKVEGLKKDIKELGDTDAKGLNTTVEKINKLTKLDLKNLETGEAGIRAIDEALGGLTTEELQKVRDYIDTLDESALQAVPALESLKNRLDGVGKEAKELTDTQRELEIFKNNLLQFFSIGNAVQLFKRAVSSAIDTVKELDAAMTEIAVVSDYDISDMWDTLPQFTDAANKLGVSIKDMYSATTLYIQQGLDMNASLELATETMKMARIAGLDAAQATDAMTAALRGFNMELNETSTQNVSDVYSKLAAITASDVEEISTAMTKTASIAHNANMEFETTAAFLSQIIETTRESAETAGTAMKTVIARFQELKKDPSEIGEVDGEIIDANKIETALRTIGVSLRDTSGQFRDLDDVFLEIAQKWDSLDTNTQRYIATMSAGSRQQSRFIAMMSNYERTMELVSAANNSAGASQEQFEKTLESLDAKLERLSNAWAEFSMGLANNEVIKFGVDLLAELLETINKLSSGAGDLGESIIKLGIAFGALKGGGALLKGLFNNQTLKVLVTGANSAGEKVGFAFGKSLIRKIKDSKELSKGGNKDLLGNLFKDLKKPEISMDELLAFKAEDLEITPIQNALRKGLSNLKIDDEQKIKIKSLIDTGELENLREANRQIEKFNGNVEVSREMTKSVADSINMIGAAAAAAALAIGSLLQNLGEDLKTDGYKELGAIISGLGKALMTLGTIMSVVIPLRAQLMAAGVNSAITSLPVLGWIAGIISGVVLLSSVISDLVETAEEKTERLKKQAEAAADAAENAQSAYEDLLDSLDKYDDTQKTLEGLVKGTNEWRQALLAANDVVLELLELYPSLSEYIERGADGQLVITEAGKDYLLDEQQDRVVAARQISAGANIEVAIDDYSRKFDDILADSSLNKQVLKKLVDLYNTDPAAFISKPETFSGQQLRDLYYSDSEANKAKAEAIWKNSLKEKGLNEGIDLSSAIDNDNILNGSFSVYSDTLYDISQTTDMTASELRLLVEDIARLGSASLEAESSIRNSIVGVLSVGASEALLSDDYSGKIQDIFADSVDLNEYSVDLEKAKEDYNKTGTNALSDEELEDLYLEKANVDEIPKELAEQGREGLISALASLDVLGDVTDTMNAFYSSLNERSEQQKDYAIRALRKDGKGLSKQMAKAYEDYFDISSKDLNTDDIKAIYESNAGEGSFDEAAQALGYVNEEGEVLASEFAAYLIENAEKTEEAYKEAVASLAFVDDDLVASLEEKGVSSDAIKQLGNLLVGIMYTGGTEAANAVAKSFDDLVEGKSVSDIEKLTTALNGLDITSPEGIRTFSETVKDLQLEVPISEESLNAFEEQIISLGKISEEISFEQMEEKLRNIKQLMESIEDREDNYSFSEEEKDQLVEVGISTDDFMYNNVDDWVYVGGSLETLLEDIRTNTDNILAEMRGDLTQALERGAAWESAFSEGLVISEYVGGGQIREQTLDATTLNELVSGTNTENYSEQFLRSVVEALGINKLEDGTVSDISDLTKEQLLGLIQQDYKKNYDLWGAVYQGNLEKQEEYDEKELESAFLNADLTDLINNQSSEYAEMVNNALVAQARKYKVDETLIKDFLKATDQGKTAATKWDKVLLGNAINAKKAQQSYAEVSEEITKITEKYDDLEKEVINEDVRKIGEALGLDELGEDGSGFKFVKENLGTIDKAFQGDIESAQELQRLLVEEIGGQEYGVEFNIDGDLSLLMSKFDTLPSEIKDRLTELQKLGLFKVETVQLKGTTVQYEVDEQERMVARTVPYYYSAEVLVPIDAEDIKQGSNNFSGVVETGTKKTTENKYDKHYNLMQGLNAELRVRERLQREYNALLEDGTVSGQELYEAAQAQIASLERQKEIQQQLLELRKQDREELLSTNSKFSNYAWYNENDNTIEIDWDSLEALAEKDPDKYDDVSAYISELEDTQEKIGDIEEALNDIEDDVEKIRYEGETDYINVEGRILDALIEKQNKIIEQQQEINESINEAATDLVGAIQDNISKLRQDRQNEDTEASLAEKERRLAYLRQDTSGANAMEIKRLEEEIAKERESYGDSLVDQALQDLQSQNDEAAEQRERQITLMQEHLEWQKETGYYAAEAHRIFEDALQNGGLFDTNSEFYQLITSTEGWGALAHSEQMQKLEEIRKALVAAYNYMMNKKEDEVPVDYENTDYLAIINDATQRFLRDELDFNDALRIIQEAEALRDLKINTKDANGVTYGERYNVSPTNGSLAENFLSNYRQYAGGYYDGGSANTGAPNKTEEGPMHSLPEVVKSTDTANIKKMQEGLNSMKSAGIINFGADLAIDGKYGPKTQAAVKALQAILEVRQDGWWGKDTYAAFMARADLKQFKTGGLADFTGPAWLDGTKSRPEMVLNAQDTENFIILKDVLSSLLHLPQTNSMHGDNYFDIDVQVEEISDDYDVDQVIERVKEKIYEDSIYRNNNSISLRR